MSIYDRKFRKSYRQLRGKFIFYSAVIAISSATVLSTIALSVRSALSNEKNNELAVSTTNYPIVESASLDTNLDVPWSEPVIVQDPFEGEFVGIFDRHFFYSRVLDTSARLEVVSLWSPDTIRFLLAYSDRDCYHGSGFYHSTLSRDCLATNAVLKITDVYLKLDGEVFRLESNNSRFAVDDKLATALRNSPTENVDIRLIVENGETVDSVIGKETVKSWQNIY